jgi:ankyrin repeat protein
MSLASITAHPFWGGRPQPLHVAIETKRRDLFDLLLEAGADVNGTNDEYDHWSPLMLARDSEREDMRDELIRRGARVGLMEALLSPRTGQLTRSNTKASRVHGIRRSAVAAVACASQVRRLLLR